MLERVQVRNFQSLRDVSLELGRFTVIVGPSSSGKSALMRALRVLASNSRGAAYVTHGQKMASVSARTQEWSVTIERGEGHGVYRVWDHTEPADKSFTKLGGDVPEQVTRTLRIAPVKDGQSINFAGQFDRPYLLDDSGAQVARTLGELTNVSVIFEASREANRRRLAASSTLRTRESDLKMLLEQAGKYKTIPAREQAVSAAESALAEVESLASRSVRLRDLLTNLDVADRALFRSMQASTLTVPTLDEVDKARNRRSEFMRILGNLGFASDEVREHEEQARLAAVDEAAWHAELHEVLTAAGVCPTCGSDTRNLELASV